MNQEISTTVIADTDRELLAKAQEIAELFARAVKLGYSITFSPEQLTTLIAICEQGHLHKVRKDSSDSETRTDDKRSS